MPYRIVVEEQEFDQYAAVIDPVKILVLDKSYQDRYETLDDLGSTKSKGPGAARNFAWEHSRAAGFAWHWVMDDNIRFFAHYNENLKVPVSDGTVFRYMEDWVERYENVAMAGPQYWMFVSRRSKLPPFVLNTRIYSCNLIRNDVPFRWRGRYNEDTILSLDMLTAGWCTVQFNAFLQYKEPTQTVKGGCDKDFYSVEGTLPKSKMLVEAYPEYARLVYRFHRAHHYVDYKPFKKNKLRRRPDAVVPERDPYGMKLVKLVRLVSLYTGLLVELSRSGKPIKGRRKPLDSNRSGE